MTRDRKFVKQDMFMYFGTIRKIENAKPIYYQPYCMGIIVEDSLPKIFKECGMTYKETVGALALKEYGTIQNFNHNFICLN